MVLRWRGLDSGEGVEGLSCLFFAEGGEVKINEGGLERGVTEVGGELMELGAAFEHMGGVAVSEGVGGDLHVLFAEAGLGGGDLDRSPDAGLGHVVAAVMHGLSEGDCGGFPTAPNAGKEPVRIAVGLPEITQSCQERGGDGDFAGFAAFPVADADDETLTVDVLWLEGEGFAQSETGLVNEGEVGTVASVAKSG